MDATSYAGGCLCGSVRYQARGPATHLCFCHCSSCQRATGAAMVPWGTFAAHSFAIVRGALTQYRSSPRVMRGFCATCGSSLTYRRDDRSDELDVTLSSLDEPAALVPEVHIWVQDKLPWVMIADGRPQFAQSRIDQPAPGSSAP
jgi:hypothetical protein